MNDLAEILAVLEPDLGPLSGEPEVLSGGITNRNVKVRLGERDYVLRICGKDTEVLSIDRDDRGRRDARRARRGRRARGRPLAPGARLPGDGLHPRSPDAAAEELRDPQSLAQVAAALRAIHAGPPLGRSFPTFTLADEYAATVRERGGEPPADDLALARELSSRIGAALAARTSRCRVTTTC